MTSPVIQADSSDARNTASGAISATRPSRPSGVFPARAAPAPPSKVPAATLPSVSVWPGAMALTRILRGASSEPLGLLRALVESDSDRILGFTAFGVGAGEILAAVQIAMIAGLPYTALRDAVLTHPTLVEGLIPLFSSAASAHNVVETRGAQISAA